MQFNPDAFKIASFDNQFATFKIVASKQKPIILSTECVECLKSRSVVDSITGFLM